MIIEVNNMKYDCKSYTLQNTKVKQCKLNNASFKLHHTYKREIDAIRNVLSCSRKKKYL